MLHRYASRQERCLSLSCRLVSAEVLRLAYRLWFSCSLCWRWIEVAVGVAVPHFVSRVSETECLSVGFCDVPAVVDINCDDGGALLQLMQLKGRTPVSQNRAHALN